MTDSQPSAAVPDDPLQAFLTIDRELVETKGWFESREPLHFSAVALATLEHPPEQIAEWIRHAADVLDNRAGWFGALTSPARFVIAATLLRNGLAPDDFLDALERADRAFREFELSTGQVEVIFAQLILMGDSEDVEIDRDILRRFRDLYREMSDRHSPLTGVDDYPACALLAREKTPPSAIGDALRSAYDALVESGFEPGNRLQLASHLLYLLHSDIEAGTVRFLALHNELEIAGRSPDEEDYNEIAMLSSLADGAEAVVEDVYANLHELRKTSAPGSAVEFHAACALAYLDRADPTGPGRDAVDLSAFVELEAILDARQAAASAAAAT